MSTATLTSLAILKANWDQNQRDYIENFVPFVAHILAENTGSPISLADLQRSMQDSFGLNVPQNSLKTILGRARRRDYVKKEGDAYFPVKEKLQNLRFQQVRERALREHQAIVNKLRNFSKTRYNMAWTTEDAEGALLRYLAGYDVEVLVASIEGAPILPAGRSPKSGKFIVNAFVRELSEEDPEGFGYLETVVKGHMLANALLFPEPANVVRKFQKTDFYLDTTFVLRLLGLEGSEQQLPCRELFDLLYQEQANLKVFEHTLMELHGILDACELILRSPGHDTSSWGTVDYLMRSGHTSSDVQLLKAQLEDSLNSFGIKVVLKPPYNHEYVIDETALENLLANEVSYRSERPLITDVDSLSAIFRLRRGRVSEFIENCTAVFLTTNTDLARASRTFFSSICASGTAAICVTDYILTNLVWLKNPIKASDLPNRLAIANSYAALQPSEQLWVKYIEEIKKLLDRNRISPDDYYLLRVSMDAKKALMDLTRGEDVDLTGKTVEQILETVKSKIRQDAQRKLQTEAEKHAKTKAELTRKEEREIARRLKVEATAAKVAHGVTKCFLVVVFILLSFGAFLSFPRSQYDVTPSFYLYLPSLFQIIIVLCGILNFTFGVTLRSVARRLEIRLKNILIRKLHRFMGLD